MNVLINVKKWLLIAVAILAGLGIKGYGQDTVMYRGGSGDGHSMQLLAQFLRQARDHYAAYGGGRGDGYGTVVLQQFSPAPLSQTFMYKGGSGDGYSLLALQQFTPGVLAQSVMYKGGQGDGYSFRDDHHFDPGYLNHQVIYNGSAGDGYGPGGAAAFYRSYLDQYTAYSGGQGDGYTGYLSVSYVPLPAGLLSFTGSMTPDNHSLLQWSVADEKDALRYELERAADGRDFRVLHTRTVTRPSAAANSYSYEDRQPLEGANYYRLRLFDRAGNDRRSNQVLLFFKGAGGSLTLFPNPATSSLYLGYRSEVSATLRLVDVKGALLLTQKVDAGNHTLSIPVGNLAPGHYLLDIRYENGQRKAVKFVKNP